MRSLKTKWRFRKRNLEYHLFSVHQICIVKCEFARCQISKKFNENNNQRFETQNVIQLMKRVPSILKLTILLAVSNVIRERGFSASKRLKRAIRPTISDNYLNYLMTQSDNIYQSVNLFQAANEFAETWTCHKFLFCDAISANQILNITSFLFKVIRGKNLHHISWECANVRACVCKYVLVLFCMNAGMVVWELRSLNLLCWKNDAMPPKDQLEEFVEILYLIQVLEMLLKSLKSTLKNNLWKRLFC